MMITRMIIVIIILLLLLFIYLFKVLKIKVGSVDCTNIGANNTSKTKAHSDTMHK